MTNKLQNSHKTVLECPILANNHFSENLQEDACVGDGYAIFQYLELQKKTKKKKQGKSLKT